MNGSARKITVVFLLVVACVGMPTQKAWPDPPSHCIKIEPHIFTIVPCACEGAWADDCTSTSLVAGQYNVCVTGTSGKTTCIPNGSVWMTDYKCESNINWVSIVECALTAIGAGISCGLCIAEPTKLSCIGCAVGAAGLGLCELSVAFGWCQFIDTCDTTVDHQYTLPHYAVTGENCP